MYRKLISTNFSKVASSATINKSSEIKTKKASIAHKESSNISLKEYKKVLGFAKRIHRQGQLNLGAVLYSLFQKARGNESNETFGTKWLMFITKPQVKNPELIQLLEDEIQKGGMKQVITTLEDRIRNF